MINDAELESLESIELDLVDLITRYDLVIAQCEEEIKRLIERLQDFRKAS